MKLFQDRYFYKWFFILAIPIALQNLLNSTLNTMDTIMIGQLGDASIAAVGLANQFFFVLSLIFFGICSGSSVFVAQFWGKGDELSIRKSLGINITLNLIPAVLFTLVGLAAPHAIMNLISGDPVVIEQGSSYLRVVALSYIPNSISLAIAASLRSVERTRVPLAMSFLSLFINCGINYVLIFGKFGFPQLGVTGAAIGTVAARVVEAVILIWILYGRYRSLAPRVHDFFRVGKDFFRRFMKTVTPVILNESIWGIGVALFSVIYSYMGTNIIASVNIAKIVEQMLSVFFFGMGYASGVMIGKTIGEGDEKKAYLYAKRFDYLSFGVGLVFCLITIAIAPFFVSFFNVSQEAAANATAIIMIIGAFMPFKNYNLTHIVGTMRSGGDTKICLLLDSLGIWAIALPLTFFSGLILHWDIRIVYALSLAEEFVKAAFVMPRIRSGKWINNLVKDM